MVRAHGCVSLRLHYDALARSIAPAVEREPIGVHLLLGNYSHRCRDVACNVSTTIHFVGTANKVVPTLIIDSPQKPIPVVC
jgi:hypothetical protein